MATDPEERKRPAPQQALGMTLSPEQQRRQRIDADMQQASARIQETKQGFRKAAGAVGDAVGTAASTIVKAGTVVPRTLAGLATGEIPVNVQHLPDYGNKGVDQRRAANWAQNNPEQAEAARMGMKGVADRAVGSAMGAVKAAPPPAAPATANAPTGPGIPMAAPDKPATGPSDSLQSTAASNPTAAAGGNLSFGEDGDSQMALDRFQRANDIRAQTAAENRRGQIGANGGLFIAGNGNDSMERAKERREMEIASEAGLPLRAMARAEDARIRREDLQQRGAVEQQRMAMQGAESEAKLGFRAREVQNAEQTGELERQRLGMDIESGQLNLAQQRQIQQMRERLADPNLDPAEREQIQRAYNTLTTPAKDRYMLQDAVMGHDALGAPVFGKQALDTATGQMVGQGQPQGAPQPPQPGTVMGGYRFKGGDPKDQKNWEQI